MEELLNAAERLGVLPLILILLGVILYMLVRSQGQTSTRAADTIANLAEANAQIAVLRAETDAKISEASKENIKENYLLAQKNQERYQVASDKLTDAMRAVDKAEAKLEQLEVAYKAMQADAIVSITAYKALEEEKEALKKRIVVLEQQVADYQVTINDLIVELKAWKGKSAADSKVAEINKMEEKAEVEGIAQAEVDK